MATAFGPAEGRAIVESIVAAKTLPGYHLLPATRADLLRRMHRLDEAAVHYREALSLATNDGDDVSSPSGRASRLPSTDVPRVCGEGVAVVGTRMLARLSHASQ
jgi:hypothetical protein